MTDKFGRHRVIIENVRPEVDGGRFPAKRTVGENVVVEADIFSDGHDQLDCVLLYRVEGRSDWLKMPMVSIGNDRWRSQFPVLEMRPHYFTIQAWADPFKTWRQGLEKKLTANRVETIDLKIGADIVADYSQRATGGDRQVLDECIRIFSNQNDLTRALNLAQDDTLTILTAKYPNETLSTLYPKKLKVHVDREKARFSTWYEMFPRSTSPKPGHHGSFKDCKSRLPYLAEMGFDVLYLPPIHPIGRTHRKGRNNHPHAEPGDVGSPWAIGAEEGGHKAVHPELGSLEDFRNLVAEGKKHGIEIALDIAFQCSPDHPYVKEHPEWFKWRPDGTVQYAENPPKKYEDIYPFDFECEDWKSLWEELKSVFLFWAEQGVRIFRVDNPHTKPFLFWEWVIAEVRTAYPEVIFLSEAFTRPRVMYYLAKVGFTQSYTYFTWRNSKRELTDYMTEVTRSEVSEFFRPNLWPNTPDILPEYLQTDGRSAFSIRLILAATLGANYGIYGPAFELMENQPKTMGGEEYLNSEKYEIKVWDINRPDSLKAIITRVNQIRRENVALQFDRNLRFHPTDNDQLICFSKYTDDRSDIILVIVNLDPNYKHSGYIELSLEQLGLNPNRPFQAHDLLSGARFIWRGERQYVELDPHVVSGHIFRIRRHVRTERDFDYFL